MIKSMKATANSSSAAPTNPSSLLFLLSVQNTKFLIIFLGVSFSFFTGLVHINYLQNEPQNEPALGIHKVRRIKDRRMNSPQQPKKLKHESTESTQVSASLTSSETQSTSGPESTRPTRPIEFSLLSFAYILARRSLPDSTLSIAGSSSSECSQRSNGPGPHRVGVEGRLQKAGRSGGPRGDLNPDPIWDPPHEGGVVLICILASLKLRMEATSSLTELRDPIRSCGLWGDIGGESDGGDIGGDPSEESKLPDP